MFHVALVVAELLAPTPFHDDRCHSDQPQKPQQRQEQLRAGANQPPDDWARYVARLGSGPVYRVEAVVRDRRTGRVGYFRVLISRRMPRPVVMGFALDDDGECVPMPDGGRTGRGSDLHEKAARAGEPEPPLAFPNGQVGVWFDPERDGGDLVVSRESCLAAHIPLRQREGQVEWLFHLGLFRVEHLSAERVRAAEPLRLDPWDYRVRVGAMQIELVAAHRAKPLDPERELPVAAELFGAAAFVDPLRAAVAEWAGRTPDQVAGKGFPFRQTWALACAGTDADADLFARLAARHPADAHRLHGEAFELARRFGWKPVRPLATVFLHDDWPYDDAFARKLVEVEHLDPADLDLGSAPGKGRRVAALKWLAER